MRTRSRPTASQGILEGICRGLGPGSQCAGGLRGIEGPVWTVTQVGKGSPQ